MPLPSGAIHAIHGQVDIGADSRDRGSDGQAPFRIGMNGGGDWSRVDQAWQASHLDPLGDPPDRFAGFSFDEAEFDIETWDDLIAALFVADVIDGDLGIDSAGVPPTFPGTSYYIEIER